MLFNNRNGWNMLGLYFAPEGDNGSGGTGDDGDTDDGTGGQDGLDAGKVEFTPEQQVHIDALIAKRLTRGRDKWTADQEAAKAAAEKIAEQARLKDKAEWQKLAEAHETSLAESEIEKARLATALTNVRIRHRVEFEALNLGFHDPKDVFRMIDLAAVEIDERGKVNGVSDALEALATAKPYLLKSDEEVLGSPPSGRRAKRKSKIKPGEIERISRL